MKKFNCNTTINEMVMDDSMIGAKVEVLSYDRDKRIWVRYEDGEIGDLRPYMVDLDLTPLMLEMLPTKVGLPFIPKKKAYNIIKQKRKNRTRKHVYSISIYGSEKFEDVFMKRYYKFSDIIKDLAGSNKDLKEEMKDMSTKVLEIYIDGRTVAEVNSDGYFHNCTTMLTRNSNYKKSQLKMRIGKTKANMLDEVMYEIGY